MRVIRTLNSLYPKKDHSWEYQMLRYSLLSHAQKTAIARFLTTLLKLVELGFEDQKIVPRALWNYWGEYLAGITQYGQYGPRPGCTRLTIILLRLMLV